MAATSSHPHVPSYSRLVFREDPFHLAYPLWPCPHKHSPEVDLYPRQTLWDRSLSGLSFAVTGHVGEDSRMRLWLHGKGQAAIWLI